MLSRAISRPVGKHASLTRGFSQVLENSPLGHRIPRCFEKDLEKQITVLDNGVTVYSQKSTRGVSTIGVLARCGSRYETIKTSGVSHFLEHLNFKRTPTRSIFDIEKETENKGLNLNAFTTRDCTTFIVNQTDSNFFEGLDLVSDMVANSLYTHEDTENEKGTIYSEVKNMHGNPWNTLAETSHFATYRNHQLGLPILGQVDNIERITSDMVKQYHRGNYHGDNIVVACAGGLEHKEIVEMAKQCFKTIAPTPSHMKNRGPTPANFTPGYMWINQHELGDSVHSIMNFEAPGFMSPDYVGFLMLANLIGEADSSMGFMGSIDPQLAFQNVGPKLNLIKNDTYFKGCYLPYEETGLFTLFLNSPIENAREAETLLLAYIEDLLLTISEEDVERAFMKNINQMLEMDSTQEMVIEAGNQLIYNKSHNPTLFWAKLAAGYASKPIMLHLIKKYLLNRNYVFVQWGNLNKVHPDFKKKRGIKLDSSEPTCRSYRHFYLRPKHN